MVETACSRRSADCAQQADLGASAVIRFQAPPCSALKPNILGHKRAAALTGANSSPGARNRKQRRCQVRELTEVLSQNCKVQGQAMVIMTTL